MISLPGLYAIADAAFGDPVELARFLFDGGARLVQVRNKNAGAAELLRQVETILGFAPTDGRVIVNDRADVALLTGADGVHLGQTDLPAVNARAILPPNSLIGVSTHNLEQAIRCETEPVDYIAAGPVFQTSTKANPEPVIGLDGLREICASVTKPVVAIGGITRLNAEAVFECGATSAAVISDLLRFKDVARQTAEWLRHNSEVRRRSFI
jgi:thiamine-phosphate pyrophosphorylase